ncbi:nuclear transport factor 2 family protein [Dactylosporangium aurantiacum]|uniref:Nuclear transport factor 2 family protein n=1 Tax=Dactylosporangium aurantiacum TaxID=35754 RepID=A0A9Q9IHF3_9ACTN|nr:nuclear transport factor 2 family protein [Dactylosporangium aurantiacum]MDG6104706.1 nuclear transport factor 2 family protein [Dactylosporangium aurantiacum]UWZ55726.1 nuclear transport factor 2 family protein [Dactylosporangium aurantiacum]
MERLFERYIHAGAVSRDADALAALFTPDGIFEAPLVPPGGDVPHRLEGRDAIRAGMAAWYARPVTDTRTVDFGRSRSVLHATADPDVHIAEIDVAFTDGTGMALVQIFRVRNGHIAHLRDYFAT